MDKFYLVMPVDDHLTGSEGTPKQLPARLHVDVFYTQSAAIDKLLYLQTWYSNQDWVIMEATFYAAENIHKKGIYCVTPTVPDFQDHPAYVEYIRS